MTAELERKLPDEEENVKNSFTEEWVFAISFSGKKFIHFKPLNEKIFLSA
jgi:hypothetical protein